METEEGLKKVYSIFSEVWKFYRKYAVSYENNDAWWDKVLTDAGELQKKTKSKLSLSLITSVLMEFRRKTTGTDLENIRCCDFRQMCRKDALDALARTNIKQIRYWYVADGEAREVEILVKDV